MKQYKSISWAYPSSPAVEKSRFAKTGAWRVETRTEGRVGETVALTADPEAALKLAQALPGEWCWMFLRYMPQAFRQAMRDARELATVAS